MIDRDIGGRDKHRLGVRQHVEAIFPVVVMIASTIAAPSFSTSSRPRPVSRVGFRFLPFTSSRRRGTGLDVRLVGDPSSGTSVSSLYRQDVQKS